MTSFCAIIEIDRRGSFSSFPMSGWEEEFNIAESHRPKELNVSLDMGNSSFGASLIPQHCTFNPVQGILKFSLIISSGIVIIKGEYPSCRLGLLRAMGNRWRRVHEAIHPE